MGHFQEIHKHQVRIRERLYELAKTYVTAYEAQTDEVTHWYGSIEIHKAERELAEFFGWHRED